MDLWLCALQATINFILLSSGLASTGGEDDANNKTIQCQRLSKDENENHSNEKFRLLGICSAKIVHFQHFKFNALK